MGHLWIPQLVLVLTVLLPAQASQLVEQVSPSSLCSGVPGLLGNVLMSNLYPEKSPPQGRTEIVSPEMRKAWFRTLRRPPAQAPSRASAGPSARQAGQGHSCPMDPALERQCGGREPQRFGSRRPWRQVV